MAGPTLLQLTILAIGLTLVSAAPQHHRKECSSQFKSRIQHQSSKVLVVDVLGGCSNDLQAQLNAVLKPKLVASACGSGTTVTYHALHSGSELSIANLAPYTQIWVVDFSSGSDSYSSTWAAIAGWYSARHSAGLIVDSRFAATALRSTACMRRDGNLETASVQQSALQSAENYFVRPASRRKRFQLRR